MAKRITKAKLVSVETARKKLGINEDKFMFPDKQPLKPAKKNKI